MDVYELVKKVGGEIVRSVARVRRGSDYIVLGRLNGNSMVLTEEGRAMVEELAGDGKKDKKDKKDKKADAGNLLDELDAELGEGE